MPKVSVIMPTFNGHSRGFLREAAESVLAQTFSDFEFVVVDDGSTDGTPAYCAGLARDPRVVVVRQENKGLAAARNTGVRHAKGEYLAFFDDDDVWEPVKLAAQVAFFGDATNADVGMVLSSAWTIDANGAVISVRVPRIGNDLYRQMLEEGNIVSCPSAVMVRRTVLEDVGAFDEEMKSLEDFDLWMRIAAKYHVVSLPQALVRYRVHGNSITVKASRREEFFEYRLFYRLTEGMDQREADRLFGLMYARLASRNFSLGDYRQVRRYARIAAAYGQCAFGIRFIAALSAVPPLAVLLRDLRRRLKMSAFLHAGGA
jgi:glycosyltransferase involved in cell wall biosynthesis